MAGSQTSESTAGARPLRADARRNYERLVTRPARCSATRGAGRPWKPSPRRPA